jgi:hypothetical protein
VPRFPATPVERLALLHRGQMNPDETRAFGPAFSSEQ